MGMVEANETSRRLILHVLTEEEQLKRLKKKSLTEHMSVVEYCRIFKMCYICLSSGTFI